MVLRKEAELYGSGVVASYCILQDYIHYEYLCYDKWNSLEYLVLYQNALKNTYGNYDSMISFVLLLICFTLR